MDIRKGRWDLVVEVGAKLLFSFDVNSVARFSSWGEVIDIKEREFVVKVDKALPSYYDSKFFFVSPTGVIYFGKGGVYVSPEGYAHVYPEGDFIYAEDIFEDPSRMKPFAIPMFMGDIPMSIIYLDPESDEGAIVRALVHYPVFISKGFKNVKVHIPMEFTVKIADATLDIVFATEIVFGRNEGVGVYGHLKMDPYELSLILAAFVPFSQRI